MDGVLIKSSYHTDDDRSKDVYNIPADEVVQKYLENAYLGKYAEKLYIAITEYKKATAQYEITPPDLVTMTTAAETIEPFPNITEEEFMFRKRLKDIKMFFNETNVRPNFNKDHDEFLVQTRRFNKLQNEKVLREKYFAYETPSRIKAEKRRTISLMEQFVYETHYTLPYVQVLRKKYIGETKYKIGFCFALLTSLKRQQLVLYTTMKTYYKSLAHLFMTHLNIFEKILRLDVDMKDLMRLIKVLHKSIPTKPPPA